MTGRLARRAAVAVLGASTVGVGMVAGTEPGTADVVVGAVSD